MDYLKKSVKTGKALYSAVDGAIRNPDQFLAHGQHQQQYGQLQYYQQQQIPQGQVQSQYTPPQPPPFPPRPGAQPYYNTSNHSVSYQQQTIGYSQSPQLPPRPQTVGPYPQQQANHQTQQYQQVDEQLSDHVPTSAPNIQTPPRTNSQPVWQSPQQILSPLQRPAFSPMQPPQHTSSSLQQPPQQAFSPVQSSQPYSPPPIGAYSPPLPTLQPYGQILPPQPVSPVTSSAVPASQAFSSPPPSSTARIVSPQLCTHTYSFPTDNGQYQEHSTPPPLTQDPPFGSHAGLAINPYHAPSAIPSNGPIVPQPSQSPQLPNSYDHAYRTASPPVSHSLQLSNPYNQYSSAHQQTAFIAELPEDNFANHAIELPAALPPDLLPSKPAEHNNTGEGLADTRAISEYNTGILMATSERPADNADEQPESSPKQSSLKERGTSAIPPSTVTHSEQIQQPTPPHLPNSTSTVPAACTTPPSTQWHALPSSAYMAYNPAGFPPMPGSPQSQSAPYQYQQAQSESNSPGYIAYSQPQQPDPYQQPRTGNHRFDAYEHQQQQPVSQAAGNNPDPAQATYAPLERMGSLAQRAQQLSVASAQFPYRTTGSDDHKGFVQQEFSGPQTGYALQNHTHQVGANVNAPGYDPHGPTPPYIQ